MAASSKLKYVAAACNRYSNVSDCRLSDGLVAFGSGRLIALYHSLVVFRSHFAPAHPLTREYHQDKDSNGVHYTLPGHLGEVTTLKFIADTFIVSGDTRGEVIIWQQLDHQVSLAPIRRLSTRP